MLKDLHNRTIDYLRISVTDRCDLRCVYCAPEKGGRRFDDSQIMTTAEILRFVRIASGLGLRKVRITGGEPLLRPDILKLVSGINRAGVSDLSLTTNGTHLAETAFALKDAGLRRVNISLDTLKPDRYAFMTRGGDINRVWSAIGKAEEAGLYPIKINIVPIRGMNEDEASEFASLTYERDYHVRFIELMPVGRNRKWSAEKCVTKDELLKKISSLGNLELLPFKGGGPSRNYRLEGAKGIIGIISPMSDCFCDTCNRLRLTSSGRLRSCLFSDETFDVIAPMRQGASDEAIKDIIAHAVISKPEGHGLAERTGNEGIPVTMSSIGG